jgi:hypothetical protein
MDAFDPTTYALDARKAVLGIITWTLHRSLLS